ncbi:MAG: bifunctional (p)ppGpp synthetase/guanosine-3',5'-bis(diphosphate) 3'-pyrophosphohydrolase [Sedimentisphaerales bacterium]|nr:bifunctional (p)ppGpp synthetase/guanosine-3',5'-bis(diphosphate) 3'-pyrophosphohydrolase [Sedimentisphaerales bacterium]
MELSERFEQALVYAHQLHRGHRRKGGEVPYVAHLLGVCSIVLESGGDEDQAIAALLHDAVEDCGGEPVAREIRRLFGDRVANIVLGCTDNVLEPKPSWQQRKQNYLTHIAQAKADELLVGVADKLYNMQAILRDYRVIGENAWSRFAGGKEGRLWYARELLKTYRAHPHHPKRLVDELERVTDELMQLVKKNTTF